MPKNHTTPARLCIIGDGYSAAALLLHLATDNHGSGLKAGNIAIVGNGRLGAGQAFGCVSDHFRLNVRAGLMQLWPDQKSHFAEWAEQNVFDPEASTDVGQFHRRRDFATYIESQLQEHGILASTTRHQQSAFGLSRSEQGWQVTLDDASQVLAKNVVVATGNPPPAWPFPMKGVTEGPELVQSPWRGDWVNNVEADSHVVIIGGGLTALDAVHSLSQQYHTGPITIVTPHGMLPPKQTGWKSTPAPKWPQTPTALSFLKCMRSAVGKGDWTLPGWQEQFEGLRVDISSAWMRMTPSDQNRLMRRLGWLWSLARFRAGPQAHSSASRLIETGQLTIIPDRAIGLSRHHGGRLRLQLQETDNLTCDVVVNCSGAGKDPLVSRMILDGVIARHQTTHSRPALAHDLAFLRPDGTAYDNLHALGPLTSHVTGDVLGAASISRQAKQLSQTLHKQMA